MSRKQLRAWLDASLKAKLKAHADERGVPMTDVVEAALHEFLNPEDYKTVSLEYLARLEKRHQVVLKRLDMLLETLGKFALVWFMNTPDPGDTETKRAMARKGMSRYETFLDKVSNSLGDAKSVRRAFEERIMTVDDFDREGGTS
jgi:hypothetical protein